MNWTERVLVRNSRPSKGREVLARQKEHFARVRAGVLNPQVKTSPPPISFLPHPAHSSPTYHSSATGISSSYTSKKIAGASRSAKRRQPSQKDEVLKLSTVAGFQEDPVEEDDVLRRKRRKLLLKGDWTGIKSHRPIDMEFPKPRESFNGPWGHSKSHHAKSKRKMCELLGLKYATDVRHTGSPKVRINNIGSTSPIQMRIRVGSREKVWRGSSNVSSRSRTCRGVESSSPALQSSGPSNGKKQACLTHGDNTSTCDTDYQSPKLPELHQPMPQRFNLPSHLRAASHDSNDAVSTLAQVGTLEPDVAACLMEENEKWRAFGCGAEQSQIWNGFQPFDYQVTSIQRKFSPGISQYGLSSEDIDDPNGGDKLVEPSAGANAENNSHLDHPTEGQKGILPSRELRPCVFGVSKESQAFAAADEASSSSSASMGSSPFKCEQHTRTNECMTPAQQPDFPGADEAPLRVMPAFCSPTDECLPRFQNIDLQDHVGDVVAPPILPGSNVLESSQECMRLLDQQKDAVTGEQQLTKPSGTKENISDIWQQLIFGNFDSNVQEAFDEAKKRDKPSDMTGYLDSGVRTDEVDFTNQHDFSSSTISTMAPVSHTATFGDSSSDPLSGPDPVVLQTGAIVGESSPDPPFASDLPVAPTSALTKESSSDPLSAPEPNQDATVRCDEVTVGFSSSSSNVPLYLMNKFLSRSDSWSLATEGQDHTPSVAHPSSVSEHNEADDSFKFARPKPFLGRKRPHLDEQRQIALSAPQIRGKSMTRRRQKRTGDGRASIRQVPNLNSDPIEEVEDAVPVKAAQ